MMQAFRTFGASKVSKALLTVLVVCFAAWGIGGYLVPSIGVQAASVNGEDISPVLLQQTYEQRLKNISQLLGGKPTKEEIDQMQIPEQVLTEVVARTVMRQTAHDLHLQPATKQLQDEIGKISAFKNEKGQFDVARYRQMLAQIGRTPQQFEAEMGQDMVVRNVARLATVETPSPSLVAGIVGAENVKLALEVATLSPASISNLKAATDADLQTFYTANSALYTRPETRDIVVLRLSRDDIMKTITIPEDRLKATYEENKASYKLPEKREVRHILVKTKEEAEKIAAGIHTLADFEKAANQLSQDPGNEHSKGGLLGSIKQDDVVPAFGKVAFSLPVATLSKPVQSNFGWHLIWVDSISPAKALDFAEIKDAIAKDMVASEADDTLTRLGNTVDEKVAAGEALSKIATDIGIKALQFNMVKADDEGMEPQERSTGFNQNEGDVSAPLQMKDGGAAYVQTVTVTPAATLPLAQVKDRVAKDWQNAQIQNELRKNADAVLSAIRAPNGPKTLADAATKAGVAGVTTAPLDVTDAAQAPGWLQRNLLALYPMPVGTTVNGAIKDGDSWHLVRVAGRESLPLDVTKLPEQAKIYQQRLQGDLEALLMSYLTNQARVTLNQTQLERVFGRKVTWSLTQ